MKINIRKCFAFVSSSLQKAGALRGRPAPADGGVAECREATAAQGEGFPPPAVHRAVLILFVLILGGCGRTVFSLPVQKCTFDSDCTAPLRCVNEECRIYEIPDGATKHGDKRFGEPCQIGFECASDFCLAGPVGSFCSKPCGSDDAGCPVSYSCKKVPDQTKDGGTALTALCSIPEVTLCQPCKVNDAGIKSCSATGADLCFTDKGGDFCARDCEFEGCPTGYQCVDGLDVNKSHKQCVPKDRTCNCTDDNLGLAVSCKSKNEFGQCLGRRVCQVDAGFTDCDAPFAIVESCNGVDDDCNGRVDDFTPPTCTKTFGNQTCTGPQICFASAGLVCAARAPTPEVCNFEDDDCNGQIDEGFKDVRGRYNLPAHCGQCGNNCATAIAHATATACVAPDDRPRCIVTACEVGFFVNADGTACLALPDTLCRACAVDADCVAPGSKCLTIDGSKVCGRDCSAASVFGTACPGGYMCQAATTQCVPVTNTCTCKPSTFTSLRSCSLSTCKGFETCGPSPAGPAWSTCDINSYNKEICDQKDNNCNAQIDEGFINPVTNRYDTAAHCGFCNNDCTKYFSPSIQHTTGVCDATPAMPACTMGPCLTEVVGGTTFEFVNVNQDQKDGCECRRVQGNLTIDAPDRAPNTAGQASWVDENCDGVDGVVGNAIFVSSQASAGGNGSRTAPFQTVNQGLNARRAQNKRYVLVAQGLYRESVSLLAGDQLFGGYASDFLKRDPQLYTSTMVAQSSASADGTVAVRNVGVSQLDVIVVGFRIEGADAPPAAEGVDGQASVAVVLQNVGVNVIIQSNEIIAGRGGSGGRGLTGTQGFGRQTSPLFSGGVGRKSQFFPNGMCTPNNHLPGGAGGINGSCAASAPAGGSVVCPVYVFAGNQGNQQQNVPPTVSPREGRGGFDWSFDTQSMQSCSHVTESGFPVMIQQHDGEDGRQGLDGLSGTGGQGAASRARTGSILNGRWVPSPFAASSGLPGLVAQPGGGGGAGGGVARFAQGGCQGWEIGASGGGGGAGACGGNGGQAGKSGGASISILLIQTQGPIIIQNRIQRGTGGAGGSGGFGGAGGLGGAGGFGGTADRWSSSVGGKGGEGGNGGPGGGGGGGAGGPSFGVLSFNQALVSIQNANTFLTPDAVRTGGPAGAGGSSPGAVTSTGTPGVNGDSVNSTALVSCAPACVVGTSCDANGVCVPD
jgi:hypothetical protein